MRWWVEFNYLADKQYSGDAMNDEKNQKKPIAEKSKQSNKVPSKEAIEIAARIMANRAKREIDLVKLQQSKD